VLTISPAPVCLLVLFTLANAWLGRRFPCLAFRRSELLVIYMMLLLATTLGAMDFLFYLPSLITYGFWAPGVRLRWGDVLKEYLPSWLTVQQPEALKGFYEGDSSLWSHLGVWLAPLAWWSGFGVALCLVLLSFGLLLWRRWSTEEKLPFPLTILPLELARVEDPIWRKAAFRLGFGLSAGVVLLNGLGAVFPSLPAIPMGMDFSPFVYFHPPWSGIRYLNVSWSPYLLGLCFLMPLDLAFSLWVFNLFWKAQGMVAVQYGWTTSVHYEAPYINEQSMGGLLGLALIVLWMDRRYLLGRLREAFGRGLGGEGANISRWALCGGLVGLVFIGYFCHRAGASWWMGLTFFAFFFAVSIAVARMRVQAGPPSHEMFLAEPLALLSRLLGTRRLGARDLSLHSLFYWFVRTQRANPLPVQLEGLRLAERAGVSLTRMAGVMMLTTLVAVPVFFFSFLFFVYRAGLGTAKIHPWVIYPAWESYNRLGTWLSLPTGPNREASIAIGAGLATMLLLSWLKFSLPSFPLHPVAYPVASGYAIDGALGGIFLTWLVKALLLRYGGLRLYQEALPFFLGLIAGEALLGVLLITIGFAVGTRLY